MKLNEDGLVIMPFGKHKDKPIKDLPTHYLDWIIGEDWFCDKFKDLKDYIIEVLKQRPDWQNMSMSDDQT